MGDVQALWLTSHYPNPADPVTGVFFRTQARALVRAGVRVHVVSPTPHAPPPLGRLSKRWRQYGSTPTGFTDEGVQVSFPRYLATPNQMRYGIADRLIARSAYSLARSEDVDLIHGHYAYPEGLAAIRLGKALGKPVIVTLHGDDANTYPDINALAMRRFLATVKGADRVLAVSSKLVERTEALTGNRPLLAPIGIDLRQYESLPSRGPARAQLGLGLEDFVVLYVGHLGERKGIAELAQAMRTADLADAVCIAVGDGPLRAELANLSNIRSIGSVPNESIPHYMAVADVLVLPTYDEGTPTVIVEAGAAGLPVAASAVGGIPALLASDRGSMFEPRDVKALVRALLAVRSDMAGAGQRAARLRSHVREHFDVDLTAQGLATTYVDTVEAFTSKMPVGR